VRLPGERGLYEHCTRPSFLITHETRQAPSRCRTVCSWFETVCCTYFSLARNLHVLSNALGQNLVRRRHSPLSTGSSHRRSSPTRDRWLKFGLLTLMQRVFFYVPFPRTLSAIIESLVLWFVNNIKNMGYFHISRIFQCHRLSFSLASSVLTETESDVNADGNQSEEEDDDNDDGDAYCREMTRLRYVTRRPGRQDHKEQEPLFLLSPLKRSSTRRAGRRRRCRGRC
jgi:hypothetical protein